MARKNKFGIEPLDVDVKRARSVGPMGAAVREAADDMQAATDAKVEQRRQNAADAKAFRAADEEGRVLNLIPVDDIQTDALPRDRIDLEAVASADEMEELKASIRARGQKEPVELFEDDAGRLQLKKGWRRLTALRQLFAESGDVAFSKVLARIDRSNAERLERYIDMVEENVVREDLSFAEMAQVVVEAARDPDIDEQDADALVNRLYGSLHKMKRSYIRSFVFLLGEVGDVLPFPKELSRNLGVEVARRLQSGAGGSALRSALKSCQSSEEQRAVLDAFVADRPAAAKKKSKAAKSDGKFSFRIGDTRVTARSGELRIVMDLDFADVPREQLEDAVRAFESAMGV